MKKFGFNIKSKEKKVNVFICENEIGRISLIISKLKKKYSELIVITDDNLDYYYGKKIISVLKKTKHKVKKYVIKSGEKSKNINTVSKILDFLIDNNCDRKILIVALGGGVIGDIAGFVASIFKRGVDLIQIPTSLMAMVDSSLGGKTGVNTKKGKNLIGTFYQPEFIFVDTAFLDTLPFEEYQSALSEVVKYGIIYDKKFFEYLEKNAEKILNRDKRVLKNVIFNCLSIKSRIVEKDEKESNLRAILNLGHTFGHSYETLYSYRNIKHGFAVGWGIIIASRISYYKNYISESILNRIEKVLIKLGHSEPPPPKDINQYFRTMMIDKKLSYGKRKYILPVEIGKVIITEEVDNKEIKKAIFNN